MRSGKTSKIINGILGFRIQNWIGGPHYATSQPNIFSTLKKKKVKRMQELKKKSKKN